MTSGSSSGLAGARHLAPEGLFLEPLGLPLVEGGAELREALVEEGAALLDVDEALLLLERLELAVELLGLEALLVDLAAEPVAGLGGGLEAQVEALGDVEVGEGVRGGGGELGAAARDGDGHEAAVADGADAEPSQEGVDHLLHLAALALGLGEDGVDLGLVARAAVLGVAQEAQLVHHAPGEAAALEQLVLRLVVVVALRVELRDLLEVEDARVVALDEDLRGAFVDGLRQERAEGGEGEDGGEEGDDDAAATEEDVDVVPEVAVGLRRGCVGLRLGWRGRHHSSGVARRGVAGGG